MYQAIQDNVQISKVDLFLKQTCKNYSYNNDEEDENVIFIFLIVVVEEYEKVVFIFLIVIVEEDEKVIFLLTIVTVAVVGLFAWERGQPRSL